MTSAMFSIHPNYAVEIYSGSKRYEYRRRRLSKPLEWMLIYETSPICKVTGYARVMRCLSGNVDTLWKQTHQYSGLDYELLRSYFHGGQGFAYELSQATRLVAPVDIADMGVARAPQSALYIDDKVAYSLIH